MARQSEDNKTVDLLPVELAPLPVKRGRKPKGERAMSSAERMAAMRKRKKDGFEKLRADIVFLSDLQCIAASRHMTLIDLRDFLNRVL